MSARRGLILAVVVVVLAIGGMYAVRSVSSDSDRIEVSGNIRADIRVVTAPAIVASSSAGVPRVAGVLATVTVVVGDHVEAGEVIAELDPTMLDLGVEQARLAAVRARAEVGLLDSGLTEIEDNRAKLRSAKGKLASTKTQLLETQTQLKTSRAELVSTRAKALAGRAELARQIAQLERLISDGTATSTPPAPRPEQTLAAMKAKLKQLDAGIAKMDAGLVKLDAGLAKVASGLAKLSSARSQIASGESALDTAARQVGDAKTVLGILVDAKLLGVTAAQAARDSAVITAPVAGVVAFARSPGSVAMVGAPLVRIRPDGARRVDTYLTAEQLGHVALGDSADVSIDSIPGRTFRGRVTEIGSSYRYPPNTFATPLTHMTRAVKLTITLDSLAALPFGTPADVVIHPARD